MTPFEQARNVYKTEPCVRSFEMDLELHLAGGFVYSTPWFFVMGRPVDRFAEHELIVNPAFTFEPAFFNCWHVYLCAGNLSAAWDVLPYSYPWMSYERENVLRFVRLANIRRLSRK